MGFIKDSTTEKKETTSSLLAALWCVPPPEPKTIASLTWDEADAYFRHYRKLLSNQNLVDGIEISFARVDKADEEAILIVNFVRDRWEKSIAEIEDEITNDPHRSAILLKTSPSTVRKALTLAIRLWLFVNPDFSSPVIGPAQHGQQNVALHLHQAVSRSLSGQSSPRLRSLSADFSAKSLIRKGGLDFEATGDLNEHLTFHPHDERRIRVFGCSRALEVTRLSRYRTVYPEDFVPELQRTMQLLFPTGGRKSTKRTRQYVKKYRADLEARLVAMDRLSLSTYPIFGERLEHIQQRYNESSQKRLRQWWYDRRKRVEWATLVVAIVVFILTVVFGIISSVTGILQVYAA